MNPRLVVVLLLASVMLHFPSYPADFSFDDQQFVLENTAIRSIPDALAAFGSPFPPEDSGRGLYRPLTAISYALDHQLYVMDAWGFHLTNTLLYALLVLLVARLAFRYSGSIELALVAGLLFSLHPVHTEVVDSVSGRSELLALLFSVASLLCFLTAVSRPTEDRVAWSPRPHAGTTRVLAASVVFYAMACMSKETGVVLPGILAVHVLALGAGANRSDSLARWRRGALLLTPFVVVLASYLALRLAAIGHFAPSEPFLQGVTPIERLLTAGAVYAGYLRLLVLPDVLQVDFYYQSAVGVQRTVSPANVFGVVAIAATIAAGFALLRRAIVSAARDDDSVMGQDVRVLACTLAIFGVFLLPVSHVFDIGALMAERFLFAPSLGFVIGICVAVAMAARRFAPSHLFPRRVAVAALAAICLLAGWRSFERAGEWRSNLRLWESAAAHAEGDARVHSNLGQALLQRKDLARAEVELMRALALDPHYRDALENLAGVYWKTERLAEAAQAYRRVLELDPDDPMIWNDLGVLEVRRGRPAIAVQHFERALRANPGFGLARRNLEQTGQLLREAEAQRVGPPQHARAGRVGAARGRFEASADR